MCIVVSFVSLRSEPEFNWLCNISINKGFHSIIGCIFQFGGFYLFWLSRESVIAFSISCARVSFLLASFLFKGKRGCNSEVFGCVHFIVTVRLRV